MNVREVAAAIILAAAILALSKGAQAECPIGPAEGDETLVLPTGCPAPWDGELYPLDLHARAHTDAAAANVAIEALVAERDRCRGERDRCLLIVQRLIPATEEVAAQVEVLAEAIRRIPDPPDPQPLWPWVAAGAGAVGGPLLACEAIDCGAAATGAAVAVGVVSVGLLAWLIGD